MGRPKGSKNKSTLEKEKLKNLECVEFINKFSNKDLKNLECTDLVNELEFNKPKNLEYLYSATEASTIDFNNNSQIISNNDKDTPETTECLEDKQIEGVKETKEDNKNFKNKKDNIICERCHENILTSPITINLTQLTGMAPYHLCCKNEKVKLCIPCAKKLISLIDSFLYNNGNGVEIKPWDLPPTEYNEKDN